MARYTGRTPATRLIVVVYGLFVQRLLIPSTTAAQTVNVRVFDAIRGEDYTVLPLPRDPSLALA